jgi:hypothetical protein
MIEFGVKWSNRGKRSRRSKKFPRKKILHRGDEKYCNWFKNNWDEDKDPYFSGDLYKFLMSNVGRPVDKVFSEFLGRCRKSASRYNLKDKFYDMFEKKEDIDYRGGFYLTNGIVNYKKRTERPYHSCINTEDLNRAAMPSLAAVCRECESTHTKQYLGIFYISYYSRKRVYVVERSAYEADLKLQAKYKPCYIHGIGRGAYEVPWCGNKVKYTPYIGWHGEHFKSKFIFITKAD